jgi:hypothetical protein
LIVVLAGTAGLEGLKDDDRSLAFLARELLDKQIKESEGRCILVSSLAYQHRYRYNNPDIGAKQDSRDASLIQNDLLDNGT